MWRPCQQESTKIVILPQKHERVYWLLTGTVIINNNLNWISNLNLDLTSIYRNVWIYDLLYEKKCLILVCYRVCSAKSSTRLQSKGLTLSQRGWIWLMLQRFVFLEKYLRRLSHASSKTHETSRLHLFKQLLMQHCECQRMFGGKCYPPLLLYDWCESAGMLSLLPKRSQLICSLDSWLWTQKSNLQCPDDKAKAFLLCH